MRPPRRQAGFTLLEVLVAFVIVALALGVMFHGVLGGMRAAAVATHTQEALAIARSRLAAVTGAIRNGSPPGPQSSGQEGSGFVWTVQVHPAQSVKLAKPESLLGGNDQPPRATLYDVTVAVAWASDGAPRLVRLDGAAVAIQAPPRA